jgi:hypothetical protein
MALIKFNCGNGAVMVVTNATNRSSSINAVENGEKTYITFRGQYLEIIETLKIVFYYLR